MQIPLFNTVLSWILKKRKIQVDMFLYHPIEVQNEILYELLSEAKDTHIGVKYSFKDIRSYKSFAKNVPIQQYESIEPLIEMYLFNSTKV